MFRKISPLIFLQLVCCVAFAQDTTLDSPSAGSPPLSRLADAISPDNLPDNWYAWNLLRKNETGSNDSKLSRPTNWTHNGNTPDANKNIFSTNSVSLAFFKPVANADGSKNYQNYMYSALKLDFTPLTLGGLYVEKGAIGTTSNLTDPSKIVEGSFSIKGTTKGGLYYLNILSSEDSNALQNSELREDFKSTPVIFDVHEDFTFGSKDIPFSGVNIYSNWNLAIDKEKTLNIFGELRGGADTTITLSNGGQLSLNQANYLLKSNWYLKDDSILKFEATVGSEDSTITSANLLGSGKVTVEKGTLEIAGKGATINNNIEILEGGKLTVKEKVRTFGATVTPEEFAKIAYYINVTGNISGKGTFSRYSEAGKNSTNEVWIFTGNNSNFWGNWETNADVDYYKVDKVYDYLPIIFGDGSAFQYGDNFYAIAGHGAIIGLVGQDSRAGMGVGFNYGSNVTIYNSLQGTLKIKHLSSYVLTLEGTNTHGYGTYAVAGGTIRFTRAENLGSLTVQSQNGTTLNSGGTVALNNGSTLSFAGEGTISLQNALFNTQGSWGVTVEKSGAVLNWDLSTKGVYDNWSKDSTQKGPSISDAKRTGDFTKTGAGTLVITAGSLITSKENGQVNNRTIRVKEGSLAFTGDATWGDASKIILHNGVTLDVAGRNDHSLTLSSTMTLTSDKESQIATTSTINGNLTLSAQSTVEFVMLWKPFDLDEKHSPPHFNTFDINGIFSLSGTSAEKGNQTIFQFTFLNGLYVNQEGFYLLFSADNDLRDLAFDNIKLAGLPETDSRQSYKLYASGAEWKDSNGILQKGYGDANGKELYLYASPDTATLTWNKTTGGTWELKGADENKASWDAKGQTIKDNDTRFYQSDVVIFGDNVGDTGETKVINIVGEVYPANVTVTGKGHYSFEGAGHIGGQTDLIKEGSGILDIWTSNSYSAGTSINGGIVNAYAENSFGTGLIRVNKGATLNIGKKDGNTILGADNALGSADLTISGGTVNIYTTNSAARNAVLNGGFIYAYGSNSLGNGTLLVNDGIVYARGNNAIGGNVILTGSGSHLYTEAINALGNTTVTVSNGAIIHSAKAPEPGWCLGDGSSIILSNGGALEVNSSTALNTLSRIKFDGGEMRVDNRKIDATGFQGNVELVNAKKAIINTIGAESQLTLSGQLGTLINANILKKGEGELVGVLSGDFRAGMEIQEGRSHLVQGKDSNDNYTAYKFTGALSGVGTMEFSGGSIFVSSDMFDFSGELYINLDQGQDFLIQTHHDANEKLFDVTINQGNFWIDDNSGSNTLHCANLASGKGALAGESKIGMNPEIDPSTVRNGAVVSVTQDRNDEFKGMFVNGQTITIDKATGETKTLVTDLEKKGAATLTLTGESTSNGTMTIVEGTIKLGNGGTTGSWIGKIVNNSMLEMDYGNVTKTYSQQISGSGLMQIGTGTAGNVIFTAKNTYTGGTVVNNGNVQLKDAGTLGTGDIIMSGKSLIDVTNKNGVEDRTIRVASGSTATIKTANLGNTGVLTSAAKEANHAAISVRKGTLDNVTLVTTDGKASLSGIVTGTSITLDAGSTTGSLSTSPILSNITLGLGSVATATNGRSEIINRLAVNYNAEAITGTTGNMEINDAKLALGVNGSYNISGINRVEINIDQASMDKLGNETSLTIHLFGKGADMTNVFTEGGTSGLSNILLNDLLKDGDWSVLYSSVDQNSATAWWKTGDIVLVKGQVVPEPSSAGLLLATTLIMGLHRKRRS